MWDYKNPGANETEPYTDTIGVGHLVDGDVILETMAAVVGKPKRGNKWVHVDTTMGKLKLELGTTIEVRRRRLTESAIKVRGLEAAEWSLRSRLDDWRETGHSRVKAALAKAEEQVLAERRYDIGSQLGYLVDVAVEQARADLRASILWMFDDDESTTKGDVFATFKKAQEMMMRDAIRGRRYSNGPLSRSSSMMANLGEDLKEFENVKLLAELEYDLAAIA